MKVPARLPRLAGLQATLALLACLFSAVAVSAETRPMFAAPDLEPFTGVLPDGRFRFALRVLHDQPARGTFPGLAAGTFVTSVQINNDAEIRVTEGQTEMVSLLTAVAPGDTVFIDTVPAGSGAPRRLTLRLPSLAQMRAIEAEARKARLLAEQADLAARSHAAGDPFGDSYWGVRLRNLALGNFETLHHLLAEQKELEGAVIGGVFGERLALVADIIQIVNLLESALKPYSGGLSAYGITRVAMLGDCGDEVVVLTQDTQMWTDYRDGFGNLKGRSSATTRSREAAIPASMEGITRATGTLSLGLVADWQMPEIVARMSCDDPWRQQLELNIPFFFAGRGPVTRGIPR